MRCPLSSTVVTDADRAKLEHILTGFMPVLEMHNAAQAEYMA